MFRSIDISLNIYFFMEKMHMKTKIHLIIFFSIIICSLHCAEAHECPDICYSTLQQEDQSTLEISTCEMADMLRKGNVTVFDVRPFKEYAVDHIPGAVNISAKPGVSKALYISDVAEISRILNHDKSSPVVIYCNGPFCGKSRRVAKELSAAGYTHIYRYQLGIPVWRALGYATQTEIEGLRYIMKKDKTAVLIDVRELPEFKTGSLPGAINIPRSLVKEGKDVGEVKKAKNDGRLPVEDHNTRIIVFGSESHSAMAVAHALVKESFHNTSFFGGTFKALIEALR